MGQTICKQKDEEICNETLLDVLPAEIVMKILRMLSYSDLMNVALVCRRWKILGEDPSLWSGFVVTYTRQHQPEMLSIKRLEKVQHINIRYC